MKINKNIIVVILFGSLIGYVFGSILFKNYKGIEYVNEDGNIYYLQYGVYTNKESAIENTKNLNNNYVIREIDDKYYVYLGVTENYDLAIKLQKYYKNQNIYTYIRSDYVENSETLDKLKEYDNKIKDTKEEEIINVMKEIFENSELNL